MAAPAKCIEVPKEDRVELERIARSATEEVRMVERAQIVLYAAEGHSAVVIGRMVGCATVTAQKWRSRYEREGIAGLRDLPRPGKPLAYSCEERARLIAKACTRPPDTPAGQRRERWTYEELAAEVGMSSSHAHTILARADVKPHLSRLLGDERFSGPRVRAAPESGLRPVRRSAGERAGRLDRREDGHPGQGADQARHPAPRRATRPGASTNISATARNACSRA